jgi:lysozyme
MQPSSALIALVKNYEGFRSEPYCCPSGLPTIGYGHTRGVSLSEVSVVARYQ